MPFIIDKKVEDTMMFDPQQEQVSLQSERLKSA
jgi:hypothetical protein